MRDVYVGVDYLKGPYWEHERAFVTDNHDGTWHVTRKIGCRTFHSTVDAAGIDQLIDEMRSLFRDSGLPEQACFCVKGISNINADRIKAGLMSRFEKHADMMSNYDQMCDALRENQAILEQIARIDYALKPTVQVA